MAESTHVALLRGINVGGRHKLPMTLLRTLFEEAGAADVRTYIQSGNVVFSASAAVARRLPEAIEGAIARRLRFDVPVITRTAAELGRVYRGNPFLSPGEEGAGLHVAFLKARPSPAAARALDPDRSPPDRFALRGRELYLQLPHGVARTRFTNAYIDATLSTISTARNWKTVSKLVELTRTGAVPADGS